MAAKWGSKADSSNPVNCRLSIPTSCFLEGQNIPISIHVQHIAPVKQMQGIQLQLERITNMTTAETRERSVETHVLSEVILPLICDVDDYSSTVNSHLTVPALTPPTLQTSISPLHICYRIKAIINVDINNLLDDTAAPSRKRDIAKGMVNSWGKRIGWTVDGTTTGILPGSIVELELPITIGTTTTPFPAKDTSSPPATATKLSSSSSLSIHSLSDESQSSLSISLPSCPPKLPVRPASISNQSSSSPNIQSASTHQQQLTASPIGDNKSHWTSTPAIPKTLRSITDPFSLTNHHLSHLTYGTAEQQPSAPELGEIEIWISNIKPGAPQQQYNINIIILITMGGPSPHLLKIWRSTLCIWPTHDQS
ncbi:hypothetical protein BCR42DRAFT_31245 [Absidia repens]|uniref:Arrestin C-terminal-like domain-containing protein n=1 Tax=Absidia repens TaxID=90262 RepID=A0A1X2IJB8_9FUNG|nr:hypothetical protein BCR42DRAFT_31245 [Absidia repens]